MPKHRSLNLKKFVDSIPESLLSEYFIRRCGKIFTLESYDYESVAKFLDKLSDENLRNKIDEDFIHINDICEKMMNILVKAIHRYGIETSGEEKRQELAMHVFLHHEDAFDYAYDYYCLFNATSKMSHHNIKTGEFEITSAKLSRFKEKIREFYSNLAKGQECIVRYYDEDNQAVIVINHGSYQRSVVVWRGKNLETLFFRPANEDILQFNKKTCILSIKVPYQKDKVNYINAFTEVILEDDSRAEHPDRDNTYTLEPLQKGTFSFAGNEVIESITLIEIKLAMRGTTSPEIVIRSSDVLKTIRDDISGISLNSGDLVHSKFKFQLDIDGKSRRVTFEITPPNVTDLTTKRYADVISNYLKENGVRLV